METLLFFSFVLLAAIGIRAGTLAVKKKFAVATVMLEILAIVLAVALAKTNPAAGMAARIFAAFWIFGLVLRLANPDF